jgi:hypothetical protein
MYLIPIVIYCLAAALFIFGLTFHDELLKEKHDKNKKGAPPPLIIIDGGKHHFAKPHSR